MNYNKVFKENSDLVLANKDCNKLINKIPDNYIQLAITSPPYFIGKEYDTSKSSEDFVQLHESIFEKLVNKIADGGSICWQIGYHVNQNEVIPLDYIIHNIVSKFPEMKLRNRIIWTYGHGLHAYERFSGRHETILWYTKGDEYTFNLDDVRVPQKYPGKKHSRGEKKGEYSGNPLGKNPSDIWNIPNVKSNHIEKTSHPCQFPIALAERLILALSDTNQIIFDPFMGVGTSGVAAIMKNRKFIGCELSKDYYQIALDRMKQAVKGNVKYRPLNKPIYIPTNGLSVAQKPSTFLY